MQLKVVQLLVSILAIGVVQIIVLRWQRRKKERRLGCKPPNIYPHRLPWIMDPWGRDLQRQRLEGLATGRYSRLFLEQFRRCGSTFEERSPNGAILCTTDDDNWRTILALKNGDYNKEEVHGGAIQRFIGRGIFTNEGKAWQHSHNLIRPLFSRAELSDIDRFKKHIDRLFHLLPRDGSTVEMQSLLHKLFLDSGTEFILGESFNSLSTNSSQGEELIAACNDCLMAQAKSRVLGGGIPESAEQEFQQNLDKIHGFVDRQISLGQGTKEGASRQYIILNELLKDIHDPVALRFELMNILLPAFESTSNVFSNILFHLARRPEMWQDLRREALALGDEPVTFELLKSLHSFRNVVLEAIRFHGSSGRLSRTAIRDTVIPRGGGRDGTSPILVRKGTRIMLELYAKLNDPKVWGDDADTFRPSRFQGRALKWNYSAFSGGPRICPAQQQVLSQSIYLLVRFLQEFELLENRDPCVEFVERVRVLISSRNGVQIALHESKDALAQAEFVRDGEQVTDSS